MKLKVGKKYRTYDDLADFVFVHSFMTKNGCPIYYATSYGKPYGGYTLEYTEDGYCLNRSPLWELVEEYKEDYLVNIPEGYKIDEGLTKIEKDQDKHKCTCDSRDLLIYGCRCGGS